VYDERHLNVDAGGACTAVHARAGVVDENATDVRPIEEIVLHPNDAVVGLIGAAGSRIDEPDRPRALATRHASAGDDRYRFTGLEPDAPRVEKLRPFRGAEIENAASFEEEIAFLGEERGKACEVDDLPVDLTARARA